MWRSNDLGCGERAHLNFWVISRSVKEIHTHECKWLAKRCIKKHKQNQVTGDGFSCVCVFVWWREEIKIYIYRIKKLFSILWGKKKHTHRIVMFGRSENGYKYRINERRNTHLNNPISTQHSNVRPPENNLYHVIHLTTISHSPCIAIVWFNGSTLNTKPHPFRRNVLILVSFFSHTHTRAQ